VEADNLHVVKDQEHYDTAKALENLADGKYDAAIKVKEFKKAYAEAMKVLGE